MLLDNPVPSSTSSTTHSTRSDTDVFAQLGLVGSSRAMQSLRAEVRQFAPRSATVLICGETGTGKESVARALHTLSPRQDKPFIAVNVATLRRDLATSELFGHARGAFTGALSAHRGYFEQAHGGTLFLDEVGELEPAAQADLLRVLETGEVRAVGSERTRTVDVRIIAATHRDLHASVAAGQFRADLYYRLNVLPVAVPSLQQRVGDIPTLVTHLLDRLHTEVGDRRVSPDALALLATQTWPGNVRQLLNVLRRATARTGAMVLDDVDIASAMDIQALQPARVRNITRDVTLASVSDGDINIALRASGGSVAGTAKRLGIPRSSLRDRLRLMRETASAS